MKWYFENAEQALKPIIIINRLIGLGSVEYPIGNCRTKYSFIFVMLTAFCFLFVSFTKIFGPCVDTDANSLDYLVFLVNKYLNTFTAIVSLINGWCNREKMQLIWKKIKLIDEAFELFGMERNYQKILIESLLTSLLWTIIFFTTYTIDVIGHLPDWKLRQSLYCVFCFQWAIHVNTVVDISFAIALSCLNEKFKQINYLLENNFNKIHRGWCNGNNERNENSANLINVGNLTKRDLIEILKHLHLELCEITKEINEIYQIQIFLEMTTNFTSLTAVLYYFMNSFPELTNLFRSEKKISTIGLILWITIFSSRFLYVNIVAERICSQAFKTGSIILNSKALRSDTVSESSEKEIEQFILQLTEQPVHISMHGFSNLGHKFIKNFLEQVLVYLVVLSHFRQNN